ncbi:MAG: response regulator receiver protein [Halanaerobium sp. 4-GBenrich]|jgi:DNA-binding response OmpR family regulator|uniref:Stage 0 sporulation protein A homolog n=1 Tax=Halanaerobium congolense TaxID=54121 RepID=A0A1G6NYJ9_9FIRM|nr:response regulator [Halanaerobium congolense]KXS47924.1 MAG: response regulator receiver protein [Halanaerobium sp. T82-1]ODS50894.1 MAG: response regulator receiver protein [Halanaerobium sp. 4-GBenrich]PUU90873.1 MAG: response regulator receiver protein [Halanaerobium sp.]PTX17802.1 response regulator receiver domain-containing protein [Halanaerobium congolense]TDP19188.1 response regulator receiver domain-containing protein [Halanaerobium congolense]
MSKILVVDDEKNIRLVVGKSLEKAGFDVYYAVDGVQAVEKANDINPDLVLLDLRLPKMNGFLVLEALKSDTSTEDIPVMILSALSEEDDVQRVISLGAEDFLVKPISQSDLLSAVEANIRTEATNGQEEKEEENNNEA